ncbi:ABC transporter substrate-binding protein (plasmid) [Bradyrhizobium sp. CB82]|uniref:ABC transporter substrate-binding protein n=1 Tax=Bradyrhizobium sp. CB82 TaxID=3039159 RepID=UPI0024B154AB|nr:ABC transporter substrate-binding protein [Bradyrhizobium sp. CB82]WFU45793.1 ABC transporter substrate-binding protein [Bradyrhizobium sp. CB82]
MVAAAALVAATGAKAEDTVKIGVNAALTGTFVSAGNTIHNGVKLAVKQINDAGGFVVNGKTYKLEPIYRDNRTDVNTAIANARELVDDIGVKAIWGTESHDFSIAMTKITNPAKVIQFTGNSSLGCCLTEDSTKPGGALHYTFQTEPQEFQRSGSTAKGVLTLLEPLLGYKPKTSVVFVQDDAGGQYLSSHYELALKANGQQTDLIRYPPETKDFTPLLTRVKANKPDVVHIWYNGDYVMIAYPQAVQLNVAPSYFLFGVDPGVWKERNLKSTVPITLSCVPVCWGAPPFQGAKDYFDQYFALGAPKGVQSSVSLLYYDYVGMFVKAMQAAGTVDDTDKIVAELEKMKYQGVVSQVPLYFNDKHQVTFATEVCLVMPNTSDQFKCAVEQPPETPPPGDPGG